MSRRRSLPLRIASAAVVLPVLVAAGCAPEPGRREHGPVGLDAFESRLSAQAGTPAAAADLLTRSTAARLAFSERMNELAARLEPGAGWLEVFDRLRHDGPTEVDALLADYRGELDRAADFVERRDLVTLPEEELPVVELQNVALRSLFPLALYLDGKLAVTTSAGADADPSYLANHCSICIPPLAVHEGYPGHHVAFSLMGLRGKTTGEAGSDPAVRERRPANRFLIEGWGLYAELLMLEQGYYDDPARELGAWRMLLLRALRATVDVELHTRAITEEDAVATYVTELGMTRDAARTEVRRHLAEPTMKASYFAGLLQILELRRQVQEDTAAGSLRELHDRLLRAAGAQPTATLAELARTAFAVELDRLGRREVSWQEPARP